MTILLAMPTAYAFGRYDFAGKAAAQMLMLTPIVLPGFVTAIFFASMLASLGAYSRYLAILLGHVVLFLPYAVRILTVSFAPVNGDVINAARDLGASPASIFRTAYWPVIRPGLFAAFLIVFILSIEEFALASSSVRPPSPRSRPFSTPISATISSAPTPPSSPSFSSFQT